MQSDTLFAPKQSRLVSIDALRGFDMLLIAGAGAFIERLEGKTNIAWIDGLARQFHHIRFALPARPIF